MTAPEPGLVRSPLSDGRWHRPHPLTPLLRGGLALIVVLGIVVANLRERLIAIVLPLFDPELRGPAQRLEQPGDPIDWIVANDLYLLAALTVLAVVVVLIVAFTLSWRFHAFRITGDDVEVRRGILFRSHRRAPLDRVQGVNLTRPFVARLIGLAKLEVVGAGTDGNVRLEYLRTADAETVRADVLRLASGLRLAEDADAPARARLADVVGRGIAGIVDGDEPVSAPETVVRIPVGRLLGARVLDTTTVALVAVAIGAIVLAAMGPPWVLVAAVPAVIGLAAYQTRQVMRALRYAIAPTPDGVRIAFGLLTTVTETIPPGRIQAVELTQPLLWRPAGWWEVRINRVGGRGAAEAIADQFTTVLPVGSLDDATRVLDLVLPQVAASTRQTAVAAGVATRPAADPFTVTPRRAWFLHPLSWWRNGFLLADEALLLRRGLVRRTLVIVPLARMQSVAVSQGPLARAAGVAGVRAHTVRGPVEPRVAAIDGDDALRLWGEVARRAVAAAAADRSHRWARAESMIEEER